ncbi:NicO-domain-containing protein [Pseudohyphozyma bogoriensis]|nr:NicO-domain-containing protein [Pseudohyphozyma bogoriensis]
MPFRLPRLTILGRSVVLITALLCVNLVMWITTIALFAPDARKRGALSLALIAWTLGLRHALDMDHIVAIDNVTRNLVSMGQLPVTCGMFFSFGHSSIVIGVTIAIIAATSNINRIDPVASVGGVIGVSVSASFLFLLAVINSVILFHTLRKQSRLKKLRATLPPIEAMKEEDLEASKPSTTEEVVRGLPATTCLARIGKPIFKLIDRPWKMYPVGVLFGYSGVLFRGGEGKKRNWRFFIKKEEDEEGMDGKREFHQWNEATLTEMSVLLTVISIVCALLISITEFMGLALEECQKCSDQAENDSGLPGYLGAGVFGIFVIVVGTWAIRKWWMRRHAKKEVKEEIKEGAAVVPVEKKDNAANTETRQSKYIAECQRVLEKSGLVYKLHGYGTGLEGEYSEVMKAIEACHEAVHAMGCPRIATDIRIGTRVDKKGTLDNKVSSVEDILSKDTA